MRDHRNLRAFQLADELALLVYRETTGFPKEEMFGLTSQVRRAAVSVSSNIAEGSGRSSDVDFLRFLDMANGSLRELQY
jgi:four helix bundle protein